MQKKTFLIVLYLILFILFSPSAFSQKFDNVWVMGYNWDEDAEAETYWLIFDTMPPRIEYHPGYSHIHGAYAGISDSVGNLLLYTNNCFVSDFTGDLIPGGDTMIQGWELEWCEKYRWHPYSMSNLFIASPNGQNKIYLFNKSNYKSSNGPIIIYADKFKYSIIDMTQNSGLGAVTEKDKIIISDQLGYGQVTAVKHGNGRDWWLPMPVEIGNKIYMVLLSRDSVYVHHEQNMGPSWDNSGGFQASFSPDGSMYARYNRYYGLYLYDFDRCDGTLSNLRYFPYTTTTQGLQGGVGFSPDNHLLYIADYDSLYQLDLTKPDINATKKLVAVYDGYTNNLWTKFSFIVPGPDGRVYVIPPSTTKNMHIINRPNLPGIECDVQQHAIEFPNPYGNPPNHPNYRLGPLDGSPCDTLGFDNHPLANFRPEPADTNSLALYFWDVSAYEPAQWYWEFGDGTVSQDTSPVHAFPGPGLYTVCLTVSNEYGADTKCKVVEVKTVGAGEPGKNGELKIYPNPTTGLVYLSGTDISGCLAEVFDVAGQKISSLTVSDNSIDLSSLSSGVYILRLLHPGGDTVITSKIIINK